MSASGPKVVRMHSVDLRQPVPLCGDEDTRRALEREYDRARRQGVRAGHGHVVAPRTTLVLPSGSVRTSGQPVAAQDFQSPHAVEPVWRRFRDMVESGQIVECYGCASDPHDDGPEAA